MEKEKGLNLKDLRMMLGDRIKRLCDENVSLSDKKREHDVNLDIALLSKNFLNAYDMEIRLKRVRLDTKVIDAEAVSTVEEPKQIESAEVKTEVTPDEPVQS